MQMPYIHRGRVYTFLFLLSVILLLFSDVSIFSYGYLSSPLMVTSSVLLASFFAFAITFLAYSGRGKDIILAASFAVLVSSMLASYAVLYLLGYNFISIAGLMVSYPFALFLTIALVLFISLGRRIGMIKVSNKTKMLAGLAIIAIIVVLMWYFYFSGKLINSSVPDDEEFLALHAVQSLLSGSNPYAMNVSALELYDYLHVNNSVDLPTLTTYNKVVGFMDYPDLYFLFLAPFYALASPSIYAYSHVYMLYSYAIFMLAFLVALVYAIDKNYIKSPNYWIIIFAAMFMIYLSSVVDFLMFAVLLFAYRYIDNKYAFMLLGLAASFQEELWIPVVLLIALRFNKSIKSGMKTALGTAATFLALNGYFILISPGQYIKDVFAPIGNLLFPSPYGVFGYTLLTLYPIPLSAFSVLFYSAIIAAAIVVAYSGRKLLVGVLSLLPLVFLYHGIPTYYFFFGTFAVACLFIGNSTLKRGRKHLIIERKREVYRLVAISSLVLIILLDSAYVYMQHSAYVRMDPFRSVEGSLMHVNNATYYNVSLYYDSGSASNYSIFAYSFNRGVRMLPGTIGLFNQSVLRSGGTDHISSSNYSSVVNPNIARFRPRSRAYLSLVTNNSTITTEVCNIYSGGFYYICPTTSIST
jgi:hypothetical protein